MSFDDDELDLLLTRAAPGVTSDQARAAEGVVAESADRFRARPERRRRPAVVVGVACGGVLLVAAGTTAAYQLSVPPFTTTDEGTVRIDHGIPVEYNNSLHRRVDCLVFMELANITRAQRSALEEAAESPRWSGYGDRVLADLNMPTASPEAQNDAIFDVVSNDLWQVARQTVPGIVRMKPSAGPVFHATVMSCAKPGGVDGKP
jgi:hypothetical protein